MLAIVGASGKIGGATLAALLDRKLCPPADIIALTSSKEDSSTWKTLSSNGIQVRHATFDEPQTFKQALTGVTKFFLVSSPRIQLDYDPEVPAPPGQGREKDHFVALQAAKEALVEHVYYTSLAFASPSKSNVMTAHERTEARLREMEANGDFKVTILREGLYNESWPLYLGYFDPKSDDRDQVVLADDGNRKLSWTSIADLGIANAMILVAASEKWQGRCVYLSRTAGAKSMKEVAELVGEVRGKEATIKTVSSDQHLKHYVEERGHPKNAVKWWMATYDAVKAGECEITDPTFHDLLNEAGVSATPVEETIKKMVAGS